MTEEQAVAVGARALARVLDLDPDGVRADTPLASLGVDSLARVCLADALEELAAAGGTAVRLDDAHVAAARTVGELTRPLVTEPLVTEPLVTGPLVTGPLVTEGARA